MYVVIAYKDHGKTGDGTIAAKKAQIESELQGAGIAPQDIVASLVPLDTPEPVALIAFDTLSAAGPANCNIPMPGYSTNAEEENMESYRTGCGVKSVMARQIANPTDLEGHAGLSGGTMGDHSADVVNGQYRPGAAPREFLPSYVISELAGSGG
jgi:type IV pilus biogenesis protein CpaD/CtpE